jgi:hypothetical protein
MRNNPIHLGKKDREPWGIISVLADALPQSLRRNPRSNANKQSQKTPASRDSSTYRSTAVETARRIFPLPSRQGRFPCPLIEGGSDLIRSESLRACIDMERDEMISVQKVEVRGALQ